MFFKIKGFLVFKLQEEIFSSRDFLGAIVEANKISVENFNWILSIFSF